MRTRNYFKPLWAIMLLVGILAFLTIPQKASAGESFNITNYLASGASYTKGPTNAAGLDCGGAINVENYNSVGFTFQGNYVTTNATHNLYFDVVRYSGQNPPGTNLLLWETTPIAKLTVPIPSGTSTVIWHTNLAVDIVGPATWIGLRQVTNTLSATEYVTNCEARLTKKIIPTRWP